MSSLRVLVWDGGIGGRSGGRLTDAPDSMAHVSNIVYFAKQGSHTLEIVF